MVAAEMITASGGAGAAAVGTIIIAAGVYPAFLGEVIPGVPVPMALAGVGLVLGTVVAFAAAAAGRANIDDDNDDNEADVQWIEGTLGAIIVGGALMVCAVVLAWSDSNKTWIPALIGWFFLVAATVMAGLVASRRM